MKTQPEHFLKVLESGSVSTNAYLRRVHNFALDMNWLPRPVLAKNSWPTVEFKEKRAITLTHNHPSGESSPSGADVKVTRDLIRAGQILGIEIVDHVIIGNGNRSSLRELGYFYA